MGFLDKAKAAATELTAKADHALSQAGMTGPAANAKAADRYFRDLGVLAYLEATGRSADEAERARVMSALQGFESQGALPSFALQTAAPPPPGAVAGGYAPPPAPGMPAGAPGGFPPPPPPGGFAPPPPPPPPPSWTGQPSTPPTPQP
jgi:hypothetical protein